MYTRSLENIYSTVYANVQSTHSMYSILYQQALTFTPVLLRVHVRCNGHVPYTCMYIVVCMTFWMW